MQDTCQNRRHTLSRAKRLMSGRLQNMDPDETRESSSNSTSVSTIVERDDTFSGASGLRGHLIKASRTFSCFLDELVWTNMSGRTGVCLQVELDWRGVQPHHFRRASASASHPRRRSSVGMLDK